MLIYPALDLKEGATVQLVGGDPDTEHFHDDDPLRIASRWIEQGASALHVVDLDAALGTGDNLWVIQRLLRSLPRPIQLGGGIRHLIDIQTRLEMGIGRVIVGTQGIKEPAWLATAADIYPDKIILAIDARGDEVAIKGWQEGSGTTIEDALARVADLPLAGLLYTDIEIEGRMSGIQRDRIEAALAMTDHPLIVSGGIGSMDDLDTLKELDVAGAVLGMSIYKGAIDLKAAIERIEGRTVPGGDAVLVPKSEIQWGVVPEDTPEDRLLRAPSADDLADKDTAPSVAKPESKPEARSLTPLWGRRKREPASGHDDDDNANPSND